MAGQTDLSGTDIGMLVGSIGLAADNPETFTRITPLGKCNRPSPSPLDLGVVLSNNYDWAVITAVADLNNNNNNGLCTAVYQLIQASDTTEHKPSAGPIVLVNFGQ